ncbi:C69 family dipeptidase [Limibacter armeniacum]|uniref:C69 family dipeptidase n=1 Tax=Limibacter armeniacum TaxID=466084 RepID=UPI002FE67085
MSDIFIAKPDFTAQGHTIFGKNADNAPNEGLSIVRIPAIDHEWQIAECTHIEIPQVKHTYEVLLTKPYHAFGAEMGMNSNGVCIGHTITETKLKVKQQNNGLTGGDLVRLGLERGGNALEALEVITSLLQEYGQQANSGYLSEEKWGCNSFLITDATDSYLLETIDREWAAVKLTSGFCALTGTPQIDKNFDLFSDGLIDYAYNNKWIKSKEGFSFKDAYSKKSFFRTDKGSKRRKLVDTFVSDKSGSFTLQHAIDLLGLHQKDKNFNPAKGKDTDICQHANKQFPVQTNGSMIAELRTGDELFTCWLTGTSLPCVSLFKPFYIPGNNIYQGIIQEPALLKNDSLWWKAEVFHRVLSINYQKNKEYVDKERLELQEQFISKNEEILGQYPTAEKLSAFSDECIKIHRKRIMEWEYYIKKNKKGMGQFTPSYKNYIEKLTEEVIPVLD